MIIQQDKTMKYILKTILKYSKDTTLFRTNFWNSWKNVFLLLKSFSLKYT